MEETVKLLYPPRIVQGWDTRHQIATLFHELYPDQELRYVLATGKSKRYHAIHDELNDTLGAALAFYHSIPPEPTVSDVDKLVKVLRKTEPTLVVGIGGGSVLDVAKAAAAIAPAEGCTMDYFYGKRSIEEKGIAFAALPTTAGTGAEITKNSVLIDPGTRIKQSIRHPFMVPDIAICDPQLTLSMPRAATANSGLDALTQAIESYITKKANPATQALALKAVALMYPALPKACRNGDDREGRNAMCQGSLLTAMSFSQSGLGAVHGLAHPLGSLLSIPHGRCCAILLPHILRINEKAARRDLTDLARATGLGSSSAFVQAIAELADDLGIPQTFAEYGLAYEHFPFIVDNCRSNSMRGNPADMSDEQILQLLEKLSRTDLKSGIGS